MLKHYSTILLSEPEDYPNSYFDIFIYNLLEEWGKWLFDICYFIFIKIIISLVKIDWDPLDEISIQGER